jgi:hypothetical protein
MRRGEKLWCLAVSGVLVLLTTLPFVIAYERQGTDLRFTGSLLAVEDGNSYIAKMRRGAEGDWLFRSPYTAAEQSGVPAFLGYLLLGKLVGGGGSHEQFVALLHLARMLAILAAVYATYRFLSRFLAEERWRKWATLLSVAGGGLGWLVLVLGKATGHGSPPLELYSPETFGFLATLTFPHLLLARACLLMGLDAYLESAVRPRLAWVAAGWLVGLVALQPLALVAAAAAIGAHQLLQLVRAGIERKGPDAWHNLRPALVALAGPLLLVSGYAFLVKRDPFLRAWAAQNVLTSPSAFHYLSAYGVLLPFAIVGGWRVWIDRLKDGLLPLGWAIALPILAYAPVAFQRRLPEGGWVALAALAAIGLGGSRATEARAWRVGLALLAVSMVTSGLLLVGVYQIALHGQPPAFRPTDQVAGYEWLEENADPGSVVLTSYDTGNALPAWAPDFVPIGHGPESAGLRELEPRIHEFFESSGAGVESEKLLQEFDVSYVFIGPAERAMGFDESQAGSAIDEVFRQGDITIYRVAKAQSTGSVGTGGTRQMAERITLAGAAEGLSSG